MLNLVRRSCSAVTSVTDVDKAWLCPSGISLIVGWSVGRLVGMSRPSGRPAPTHMLRSLVIFWLNFNGRSNACSGLFYKLRAPVAAFMWRCSVAELKYRQGANENRWEVAPTFLTQCTLGSFPSIPRSLSATVRTPVRSFGHLFFPGRRTRLAASPLLQVTLLLSLLAFSPSVAFCSEVMVAQLVQMVAVFVGGVSLPKGRVAIRVAKKKRNSSRCTNDGRVRTFRTLNLLGRWT